jgi:hypothetical protein
VSICEAMLSPTAETGAQRDWQRSAATAKPGRSAALAHPKVHAVLTADDRYSARDALELIHVDMPSTPSRVWEALNG